MTQKFVNNFSTTISQTFGNSDTYLYLASTVGLPVLTGGDFFLLTLFRKVGIQESGHEVVKVTAIVENQCTVVRSFEGATASQFNLGDRVEARATAFALATKADAADLVLHTSNTSNPHSVTKAQVGLGSVDNTADTAKPVSTLQAAAIAAVVYTHPANHAASVITQDASNRFVTDAEKTTWNDKQATLVSGTNIKTINSTSLLGTGDIALVTQSQYNTDMGDLATALANINGV